MSTGHRVQYPDQRHVLCLRMEWWRDNPLSFARLTGVGWTAHFQRVRTPWHVLVVVLDGENVPSALLWFDEQRECSVAMIEQSAERCFIQALAVGCKFTRTGAARIDHAFDFSAQHAELQSIARTDDARCRMVDNGIG